MSNTLDLAESGTVTTKDEQIDGTSGASVDPARAKLPFASLIALALSGFITILTEALPAGLLPQISDSLNVTQSGVGQLVTIYAVGSFIAAIPLTAATRGWKRKRLLEIAIAGFALGNIVTALSNSYSLTMLARLFAGISAGLLWALLAGYAARMVSDELKGRAIAVAMVGTPLALSIGVPAATYLGILFGWRAVFGAMSLASVLLMVWVSARLPDFPGQSAGSRRTIIQVVRIPGIKSVLLATLGFVLAHNVLYTYIAAFLELSGNGAHVDLALLQFGVFALVGIFVVGALIDHKLRELTLISTVTFAIAAAAIGIWPSQTFVVMASIAAWGLSFGGMATLLQTASAKNAGDDSDVAQSMLVTAWNIAIAGGGLMGGLLLGASGAASLPWCVVVLLILTLGVVLHARHGGFPKERNDRI